MTNEEALKILKDHNAWRRDNGDTAKVVMHNPKVIGEAIDVAIAYMQEQNKSAEQSEPVAWYTEDYKEDKSATTWDKSIADRWKEKGWPVNELFTTSQKDTTSISGAATLRPLKRLDSKQIWGCLHSSYHSWQCADLDKFAKAIMDEMERINK